MKISGLQKATTIDYPGEVACAIFLHGCNFRCGFCHNPDLVVNGGVDRFSVEDVLKFLKKRKGKLDAVCITGGEPLISLDFDFVRKVKDLGYKVKIDTNGSFPNKLKELIDLDLVDYIAMDVKSVWGDYSKVVAVDVDLKSIERSIKMVHEFGDYEFRTTVVGRFHDVGSIVEMGKWLNGICRTKPKRIFLQGFKKSKTGMVDDDFQKEKDIVEEKLLGMKDAIGELFEEVGVRV
jgi:pyruvate formate lyase activating enzyme